MSPIGSEIAKKVLRERASSYKSVNSKGISKDSSMSLWKSASGVQKTIPEASEHPSQGKGPTNVSPDALTELQNENDHILKEYISMNALTLQFSNGQLENEFFFSHMNTYRRSIKFVFQFTIGFNICFIAFHSQKFTISTSFIVSVILHCSMLLLSAVCICLFNRLCTSRTLYSAVFTWFIVSFTLSRLVTGSVADTITFSAGENDLGFLFTVLFGFCFLSGVQYFLAVCICVLYLILSVSIIWANPEYVVDVGNRCAEATPWHKVGVSFYLVFFAFIFLATIRALEVQERRDYRLMKRLAAENIVVQMEMTTLDWFSRGVAEVVPEGGDRKEFSEAQIKKGDIKEKRVIGAGAFGDVCLATWKGMDVAVKKIRSSMNEQSMVDFGIEAATMSKLRHPNIVMFFGFCPLPPMIVMEYMPRQSLYKILHQDKIELDTSLKLRCILDAAKGLNFLHLNNPPILHLDVKSMNILVDNDWRCKVCDFGLSKLKFGQGDGGDELALQGSLPWIAPELLQSSPSATEQSDVYSFGVVLFEVATGNQPYANVNRDAIPLTVLNGSRPDKFVDLSKTCTIEAGPTKDAWLELMRDCWASEADDRPTTTAVIERIETIVRQYFDKDADTWNDHIIFPSQANPKMKTNLTFSIDVQHLKIGPKIGGGSYGEVFEGKYFGTHVAVKQLFMSSVPEDIIEEFNKECELMLHMRHPNVVLFMGSYCEPPKLLLVTELLVRGSLHQIYKSSAKMEKEKHLKFVHSLGADMARGLNYLHLSTPPILHRDMKSPNVLLDQNWTGKIADFGLSKIKEEGKAMTSVGSPLWCAPEILRGEDFGSPCDVYSFAIVLWEAMEWDEPYPQMSSVDVMQKVAFKNLRPPLPDYCPKGLAGIMLSCWEDQPDKRPDFTTILKLFESIEREARKNKPQNLKQ